MRNEDTLRQDFKVMVVSKQPEDCVVCVDGVYRVRTSTEHEY